MTFRQYRGQRTSVVVNISVSAVGFGHKTYVIRPAEQVPFLGVLQIACGTLLLVLK